MIGGWGTPEEMTIKSDVPFMAVKEYEYIRDLINEKKYETVLEWGAGSSTIWFPNNTNVEWWIAVEHNPKYVDYLKNKVNEKVELHLATDKKSYLEGCTVGSRYDFILIDGLYRDECLAMAFEVLDPKGTIILHDSGRKEYKDWYQKYPHKVIFEGEGWLGDGWDHRGLTAFTKYE